MHVLFQSQAADGNEAFHVTTTVVVNSTYLYLVVESGKPSVDLAVSQAALEPVPPGSEAKYTETSDSNTTGPCTNSTLHCSLIPAH